jgi:hypothetical protein
MREIVSYANIGIANEEDCQKALGVEIDGSGKREGGSGKGEAAVRDLPLPFPARHRSAPHWCGASFCSSQNIDRRRLCV